VAVKINEKSLEGWRDESIRQAMEAARRRGPRIVRVVEFWQTKVLEIY
jgi:hypothetical protein